MEIIEIKKFAEEKFESNGLLNLKELGWSFKFNKRKKAFGCCKILGKTIYVSTFLLHCLEDAQIKDTVLHEIAHAIDYEKRGFSNHDSSWKSIALQIGCSARRTKTLSKEQKEKITYKWEAHCENCGIVGGYQKKPKYLEGYTHKTCGGKIAWKKVF